MKEIKITEIENIRIGSAENKKRGPGVRLLSASGARQLGWMSAGAVRHPGNQSF